MSPLARVLFALVRGYQLAVSPRLTPSCRFEPSCSEYAAQALRQRGALRGSWLALRRLVRCQPLCRGGFDPVPPVPLRREGEDQRSLSAPEPYRVAAAPLPVVMCRGESEC